MSILRELEHLGHEAFLAVDQAGNVLAGLISLLCGHGATDFFADESISAHSWRRSRDSVAWDRWRRLWDALFYWQDVYLRLRTGAWPAERHCQRAYGSERERLGLPPEYRT